MNWVEEIVNAFKSLGGEADYEDLYNYIQRTTTRDLPASWKEIIRARIEERSSDSDAYKGNDDLFFSVNGKGSGRWGLRGWDIGWIALEDEETESTKYWEGSVKQIPVNIYERNAKARRDCINHYGATCVACGFNFEEHYGELGKGFIHVHHIKPLVEIKEAYQVDPVKDLVPVCPNCHAMLHMKKPALTVEELIEYIKQ